jgi:hypothetical protein
MRPSRCQFREGLARQFRSTEATTAGGSRRMLSPGEAPFRVCGCHFVAAGSRMALRGSPFNAIPPGPRTARYEYWEGKDLAVFGSSLDRGGRVRLRRRVTGPDVGAGQHRFRRHADGIILRYALHGPRNA